MIILTVVLGVAVLLLAAHFFSLRRQLRRIDKQLQARLTEDKYQPLDVELLNKDLNRLTATINKWLKQEEDKGLMRIRDENHFKEMVADISHDLRTPLTAIKGYLQLVGSEELSEKQKEKLRIAEKHADELGDLLEHFLEYSYAINAGQTLNFEKVELSQLVADCLIEAEPLFNDKGLKLNFETESFAYADLDREACMRLIRNLINNALQHSPSDITVRIYTSINSVTIMFANAVDCPLDTERIFDRFYTSSKKGSGLGLAIVKMLAQQIGGDAYADLQENILSIFVVFSMSVDN